MATTTESTVETTFRRLIERLASDPDLASIRADARTTLGQVC